MSDEAKKVVIYTDGACTGNPGPGGYAAVLLHGKHRKELSAGYRWTTNNRMELMAAIAALRALKARCKVVLHSDSQYLINGIEKGWARRWRENGWKLNRKKAAQNADLWSEMLDLIDRHEVEFRWVRGHSGDPENERCDRLAVEASKRPDLPADTWFENLTGHGWTPRFATREP